MDSNTCRTQNIWPLLLTVFSTTAALSAPPLLLFFPVFHMRGANAARGTHEVSQEYDQAFTL